MCMQCGPLIKAIDAYLRKADNDLTETLGSEGYIEPQETVDAITSLEERVAAALLSETDYILQAVDQADSLAQFQMDIWPKLKDGDTLQADLQAIFLEELGGIVCRFAGLYFSAIENAGSVAKASVKIVRVSKQTTAWVQSWSKDLASIMQLNSHKEIESILTAGLEDGIGIPKFARKIMDSGIRDEWYKARRVAVTEVLTAHRAGQQEAYLQSPSTTEKMWRHTGIYINGPRQNHKDMDGHRVPKDQPFELLGADGHFYHPMFPGDSSLPPGERIECHCTTQGIVDEDILGLPLEERQRLQQEAIDELDDKWFKEQEDRNKDLAGYTDNASSNPEAAAGAAKLMGDYLTPDGSFDLETAKADYKTFLQSVPEKNRMYLEQSVEAVTYEQVKNTDVLFAYDRERDAVLFNPEHPMFSAYDLRVVFTHELSHRIDHMFAHSTEQPDFIVAIQDAEAVVDEKPDTFIQFCKEKDRDGFLSDIISAICKGKYKLQMGHEPKYWSTEKRAKEIFANLFSLQTYGDSEKIEFLQENFPKISDCFDAFEFLI